MTSADQPESPAVQPAAFDAFYYKHCCGKPYFRSDEWLAFFGAFADRIAADFTPKRVLDAGCALGLLVESLRTRGVETFGIDVSTFAIEAVHESLRPFCRLGSITGDLGGRYDLIVCIEVLEHMPVRDGEAAIANMCANAGEVLFSSSPLDYREPTHVNVNPPEYWAELFARHGFYRDVDYDASYITPWAVRFRPRQDPTPRIVRDYERRYWRLLMESTDARAYSTEVQRRLAAIEGDWEQLCRERQERLDLLRNVEALNAALKTESEKLAQALDTIHHMERSRFWQLRLAFEHLKKVFGS